MCTQLNLAPWSVEALAVGRFAGLDLGDFLGSPPARVALPQLAARSPASFSHLVTAGRATDGAASESFACLASRAEAKEAHDNLARAETAGEAPDIIWAASAGGRSLPVPLPSKDSGQRKRKEASVQ
jgi:hypothetical protein